MLKKVSNILFSTRAAGLYMLLFATAIGVATFIENDYGTSSAQKIVFRAWWFELLLVLFGVTIIFNIFRFRMIQSKKWTVLTFHSAIIVILIGSGITRYTGYEGIMHIREGASTDYIYSSETYLQFEAEYNGGIYRFDEQVHFASLGRNHFRKAYQIEDKVVEVKVLHFLPNPVREIETTEDGVPLIKLVVAGASGREEYFLRQGDFVQLNGTWFNFGNPDQAMAVNIHYRNDSLLFSSPKTLAQMVMATQEQTVIEPGLIHMLRPRALYSHDSLNFVLADFRQSGRVVWKSEDRKMRNESIAGLLVGITVAGEKTSRYVFGNKGMEGRPVSVRAGGLNMQVSYGAKQISLPFSIRLNDFILEKYPGTNSASSYASEVTLEDPRSGIEFDQRIYMNHILDHKGFRFFQSSYDQDELGTVLSVNHDFWGTWVSYFGYALLTIGMLLTLMSKRTRFQDLARRLKKIRQPKVAVQSISVLLLLAIFTSALASSPDPTDLPKAIPLHHASHFSKLLVQDHKGRLKPMNTMSSEVLRKISRKSELHGRTADQVFLGMMLNSEDWIDVPLIKIGRHEQIHSIIGVQGPRAAFSDFFDVSGHYKLHEHVREAYGLDPIDRTAFHKELMKLDERVNICNLVFGARLMRLYPVPGDPDNRWLAPGEVTHQSTGVDANEFIRKWYLAYVQTVNDAAESGDWAVPEELVSELHRYQQQFGGDIVISDRRVDLEIALNKMNIFSRLGKWYGLLGLAFLVVYFTSVFNHKFNMLWPRRIGYALLALCFLAHTTGLGMRWYVSGHAPWSNGYESMIYIAWTTILSGLIFARKSLGGMAATTVLGSTILMVAGLSWLDPEITPLVPVLKSYWLTIHVSLEAGSYGFLVLGAIIGVLNLVAMIFGTQDNKQRILAKIKEMSYISEMTLIGGLFMISIGTYLGGVWANESWGRYWGWDAKETWALVTILVYAFILHMRLIPGLRGFFAFNVASLFGFASVMMTYYGVNYYLSGLHSYAAGDPVPIPSFVYYTVASLVAISLLAYWKHRTVFSKP